MAPRYLACVLLVVGVVLAACSSDDSGACDDAKCAAGNRCLPLAGETKCRKTCASNSEAATSCPFGYTCADTSAGVVPPFCVQDKAVRTDGKPLVKKDTGQWGAKCRANLGTDNADCDREQGFFCYGVSPTDGDAYCTRYDCASDAECGAGFGCASINVTPNVVVAQRKTIHEQQNVCLRRQYCSACKSDIDCPKLAGTAQHCVPDAADRYFCTPECTETSGCATDAQCGQAELATGPTKLCYPRSKLCIGQGNLCDPCQVDSDCGDDGVCLHGEYTTEKFCAKKTTSCSACPKTIPTPARTIGCATKTSDSIPAGYCLGLYEIGGTLGGDIGCWTPNH